MTGVCEKIVESGTIHEAAALCKDVRSSRKCRGKGITKKNLARYLCSYHSDAVALRYLQRYQLPFPFSPMYPAGVPIPGMNAPQLPHAVLTPLVTAPDASIGTSTSATAAFAPTVSAFAPARFPAKQRNQTSSAPASVAAGSLHVLHNVPGQASATAPASETDVRPQSYSHIIPFPDENLYSVQEGARRLRTSQNNSKLTVLELCTNRDPLIIFNPLPKNLELTFVLQAQIYPILPISHEVIEKCLKLQDPDLDLKFTTPTHSTNIVDEKYGASPESVSYTTLEVRTGKDLKPSYLAFVTRDNPKIDYTNDVIKNLENLFSPLSDSRLAEDNLTDRFQEFAFRILSAIRHESSREDSLMLYDLVYNPRSSVPYYIVDSFRNKSGVIDITFYCVHKMSHEFNCFKKHLDTLKKNLEFNNGQSFESKIELQDTRGDGLTEWYWKIQCRTKTVNWKKLHVDLKMVQLLDGDPFPRELGTWSFNARYRSYNEASTTENEHLKIIESTLSKREFPMVITLYGGAFFTNTWVGVLLCKDNEPIKKWCESNRFQFSEYASQEIMMNEMSPNAKSEAVNKINLFDAASYYDEPEYETRLFVIDNMPPDEKKIILNNYKGIFIETSSVENTTIALHMLVGSLMSAEEY